MVISVGVFLIDKHKRILIGHPTHSSDGSGFWSIPKGKKEADESYHTTMGREFTEETGLLLTNYPGYEIFLGAEEYVHKKKTLVAFAHFVDAEITDEPHCISFVTEKDGSYKLDKNGSKFPEMDKFAWVSLDEAIEKLHYTQSNILKRNRFIIETAFADLEKFPGQTI